MDTPDLLGYDPRSLSIINLESLLDLSGKLNEVDDEHFILNSAVLSLMGKLRVVRSCVFMNHDGTLELLLHKGKKPDIIELTFEDEEAGFDEFNELVRKSGFQYIFPVHYKKHILAVICLGSRMAVSQLQHEEQRYAELLTQIAANALQNARSHNHLVQEKIKTEKRNQLLTTLFEVTRDFSNLLSRDQILKMLSYHLMGQLMVNRFAVLIESTASNFEPLINRFEEGALSISIKIDELNFFTSYITNEEIPAEIRVMFPAAEVISPMIVQGKTKGLLLIGKSKSGKRFDEMNMHFISALGNTAMASLENDRLFREELIKIGIENELMFALEIQNNLLPKDVPEMPGFSIAGKSIPSRHVGGDYFDFIRLDENRLLVAIADVSGKGMPASLIMANVQAALRVLAPLNLSLVDLILKLNNLVYINTSADKFITFFAGILDIETSKFRYINAGHNPPVLCKAKTNELIELHEGGLILGCLIDHLPYDEGEITFEPGDTLLMYTDGLTESMNENMDEYGEKRLFNCFIDNLESPPSVIVENIISDISRYFHNHYQYDDLTLIVLAKDRENSSDTFVI